MQAAAERAREAGYLLDIVVLDPQRDDEIERAIGLLDHGGLAGVMAFAPTKRMLDALRSTSFAVPVYADFDPANVVRSGQFSTNVDGTQLVIRHLLELGHSRFYSVTGPLDWFAAQSRLQTYHAAIAATDASSAGHTEGDWSAESGFVRLSQSPLPSGVTAVVAANDQMAIGAMKALRNQGLRVPQDVSVVGFDNIPEGTFIDPALTTVGTDHVAQGRLAMDRLLAMIDPALTPPASESIEIHPELIVRDSSGPPRRVDHR